MMLRPLLLFVFTASVNALTCNFLAKNQAGFFVEAFGPCARGTSYCASRVVTTSGWEAPVFELFEWYCENIHNVTSYLKVSVPPNQGCFTYARDEHLCFCNTDLCNTRPFIASIFNGYREAVRRGNEAKRTELIGSQPLFLNQRAQLSRRVPNQPSVIQANNIRPSAEQKVSKNGPRPGGITVKVFRNFDETALAEKKKLAELKRLTALKAEAEKDRRWKEQKEHEEALREENRRRFQMKLAKRRREELIDQHWNRKTVRVTITTTVTTPTVQQQGALESADDDDVTDSSEVEELSREETDSSEADDSMEFVSEEVELENAAVEKTSRSIDVGERNDKMDERKLRSENVTETTATSVPADLAVEPAKIMVMGEKILSG